MKILEIFGIFFLRDFEYVEPISTVNWSFKEFVLCCELIPNALFHQVLD